jgi:hypothetical protein
MVGDLAADVGLALVVVRAEVGIVHKSGFGSRMEVGEG